MSCKAMIINIKTKIALIVTCRVIININAKQQSQFPFKRLLISQKSVIHPWLEAMIPLVKLPLLNDWDFVFHSTPQANLSLYSYIMDYKIIKILIKTASDQLLRILRQHKLGTLPYIDYKNNFLINTISAYNAASVLSFFHSFSNLGAGPNLLPTDTLMETVFKNGIKMFRHTSNVKRISYLVAEYLSIQESQGFV